MADLVLRGTVERLDVGGNLVDAVEDASDNAVVWIVEEAAMFPVEEKASTVVVHSKTAHTTKTFHAVGRSECREHCRIL